jgi:hypothetical protein
MFQGLQCDLVVVGSDPSHSVACVGVLEAVGEYSAFVGAIAPSLTIGKIGAAHGTDHSTDT